MTAGARIIAQTRMELRLLLRNGENLLVTLGLPVGLLAFFSLVPVLPTGGREPVTFLLPGVLTAAVMGASMVSLAIATGFERSYFVLKRLGATPLRRGELITAKACSVVVVEILQVTVLLAVAALLGWRADTTPAGLLIALVGVALATAAFAGIGLGLAGALPAMTTLAGANALFLALLVGSGLLFPLSRLPAPLATAALLFPPAWLTQLLRGGLTGAPVHHLAVPLAVLAVWACTAPLVAARLFRWD